MSVIVLGNIMSITCIYVNGESFKKQQGLGYGGGGGGGGWWGGHLTQHNPDPFKTQRCKLLLLCLRESAVLFYPIQDWTINFFFQVLHVCKT